MESIQVSNPYLRNAPSCRRFQSTLQFSINWSVRMLFAIATVVAEVLTLHAYSQGKDHDFVIDLTNADINRSRVNRRKFIIKSGSRTFNIFCNNNADANVWALILSHSSSRRFEDFYRLGKQIADGRHSRVYLAYAKNGRSTKYIVKVNNRIAECNGFIFRSQYERDAHLQLIADFEVRRQRYPKEKKIDLEERKHREHKLALPLEKIVTLRDSFGTPTEDFLVFPYQDGEILSTAISKYGLLSEREARFVMWDLLTAVHFMHEKGVVHRDVCASNVFYWDQNGKVRARLFDLSDAREILDDISGEEPFRDNPGRQQYKALEILSGRYHGKEADIWSCGVLLYRMLSGSFPFQGETEREVCENIKGTALSSSLFAAPVWDTVSREAILLIKQMLQPDPFKRPSALGARSHEWLSDENVFRQQREDNSRDGKRMHVSERLQTPITGRQTRASSAYDRTVLPAPFDAEQDDEEFQEHKLRMMDNGQSEVVSSGNELPPTVKQNGGQNSNCSAEDTTSDVGEGDTSEDVSRRSGGSERRRVSFVTSIARTLRFDRLRKALAVSDKLTKLQATFNFKNRNQLEPEDIPDTSSDVDLEDGIQNIQPAKQDSEPDSKTEEATSTASESSVETRLPDRKRRSPECFHHPELSTADLAHSTLPLRHHHALTHRCNHLCDYRPCTRSVLIARTDKLLKSRLGSMFRRSVIPNSFKLEFRSHPPSPSPDGSDRRVSRAPDRALCVRQQQRVGSASEIMPITRCLDDDVFLWAIKTKLFSDLDLKLVPSDPLYYCRGSNSPGRSAKRKKKDFLSKPSSFWKHSAPPVPLRDEMCIGTPIMKSVIAAAHVGLPQFTKSRPAAARLLLGSPTAQLHLSMILPYRRKFRTAALVLVAMFRMISLKKGSCLTRRVARGQPLPEELLTLLTDIRRKCHMRPLRARMPKLLPSDSYAAGAAWRKERVEPRPRIPTTRQRFWSRQWEVKKGIVTNAWRFVKNGVKKVSNTVRHGRSQEDCGESQPESPGELDEGVNTGTEDNGCEEAGSARRRWRFRRLQRRS